MEWNGMGTASCTNNACSVTTIFDQELNLSASARFGAAFRSEDLSRNSRQQAMLLVPVVRMEEQQNEFFHSKESMQKYSQAQHTTSFLCGSSTTTLHSQKGESWNPIVPEREQDTNRIRVVRCSILGW
mmetsp:Transcript_22811/g.63646  ORF Transcript_22811/g.63646 Transcript_22811/m.63646 type:complete len:128 (+) Transcript_22811:478-861(+)